MSTPTAQVMGPRKHDAPGYEDNVLKYNTNISKTTNSMDDVLEIGSIPDTIPVSEQGPPPSQSTSDAQDDNGRRGQTCFESAKHQCKECRQGFNRKRDYVRHLGSIGHKQRTRSEGEQGTIEASCPSKCTEAGCVNAYTRDDALKRHMRRVHQRARWMEGEDW